MSSLQEKHSDLSGLAEKATFQMNDTHPTIAGQWGRKKAGAAALVWVHLAKRWQRDRGTCAQQPACLHRTGVCLEPASADVIVNLHVSPPPCSG